MRDFTIKSKKLRYSGISFIIILLIWKMLTLFFPPLIVPTISSVIYALVDIFSKVEFVKMIVITLVRLFIGLTIGVFIGLIVGIFMGFFENAKNICSPVIHMLQTVPPVSWVVLALVWFGFNGRPAIFIVVISTIPTIAINVCEGILNIDRKLLEMSKVYKLSFKKKLRFIILPSILPYFNSAFEIALGGASKITVMGEVLTTSDGIGGMIKVSRLNIEPEYIIAWSIIIVMIFYISNFLFGFSKNRRYINVKTK